jgi:glycosyltransferase involved in cell wall biosynthesis
MPDFLVFSAFVPRLMGSKVVLDMHDFMPETFGAKFSSKGFIWRLVLLMENLSTGFAHHIITVHDPYVKLIEARGVRREKITSILNLPDHHIFYPRPFKHEDIFTIIYFGTIAERHGIDLFLRSLAVLKKECLPIRFLLIGEGDVLPKIKQLAQELHLGEMLELIDQFVNVRELPNYIQRTQMGIIPYRADPATRYMLPVKLLEFVFMELPVVASRLETICAYFDEDMLFYVPPEDVSAMADAVRKLYHSEELRLQLVENARSFTLRYNWEKESEKLYSVYDQLTSGQ